MKLHEALQRIVRQFSAIVLQDDRLMVLLSAFHAFDSCPGMRQVMETISSFGYGRELYSRRLDGGGNALSLYADEVKKALAGERNFPKDLADYAVDSVLFALGRADSVAEPSFSASASEETGSTAAGVPYQGSSPADVSGQPDFTSAQYQNSAGSGREPASPVQSPREGSSYSAGTSAGQAPLGGNQAAAPSSAGGAKGRTAGEGSADRQGAQAASGRKQRIWHRPKQGRIKRAASQAESLAALANCRVAEKYYYGIGTERDFAEAFRRYSKAAEMGNAAAKCMVGYL